MTEILCKACRSAPPAVEGLCTLCAREQLPAANPRAAGEDTQPRRSPPADHAWRSDFLTTKQAAERRGFSVRTARNRAENHKIAVKRGREWLIYEPGLEALASDDTGGLVDAQRYLDEMSDG